MTRDNLYFHKHGGALDCQPGLKSDSLLDFSVNISPLPPPVTLSSFDSCCVRRYPSIDGQGIKDFYVGRFGLDSRTVLSTNGAIEGIYLLPRALKVKKTLVLAPSFFDYERACRIAGAEVRYLNLQEKKRFTLPSIDTIAAELQGVDAFFAANPNNPTGTRFPKEVFLALASRFPDKWFIMDEAFIQYVDDFPGASLMREVKALKNVIVVHSLTKFYALPGLRLGAVIAHRDVIEVLLRYKEPWTVNIVAEHVARELLECNDYERDVRAMITSERAKIFKQLKKIPEISLKGYAANFFLARWNGGSSLDHLLEFLKKKGILVRDCRNFPGLRDNYFRFVIRKPDENDRLLERLLYAREEIETVVR
ncbi:threonine-phosphate decarboxylase CobD [Prosthecochloris sp.]|uniref:threonine-phosphate decarboxylase CobD n=1 Tax=Prosthecochloris sp. TaxID=290513 RepID=UPI00257EDE39|nr:threonine-phosphate decarboxylase CobD [Prosthecochloris sp.]